MYESLRRCSAEMNFFRLIIIHFALWDDAPFCHRFLPLYKFILSWQFLSHCSAFKYVMHLSPSIWRHVRVHLAQIDVPIAALLCAVTAQWRAAVMSNSAHEESKLSDAEQGFSGRCDDDGALCCWRSDLHQRPTSNRMFAPCWLDLTLVLYIDFRLRHYFRSRAIIVGQAF